MFWDKKLTSLYRLRSKTREANQFHIFGVTKVLSKLKKCLNKHKQISPAIDDSNKFNACLSKIFGVKTHRSDINDSPLFEELFVWTLIFRKMELLCILFYEDMYDSWKFERIGSYDCSGDACLSEIASNGSISSSPPITDSPEVWHLRWLIRRLA